MKKLYKVMFSAILWVIPLLLMITVLEANAATQMPAFALKSVHDGKIVSSKSFKGKVLFVTFFATYCPPCVAEMESLVALQKDLAPAGFSVIGFSLDQGGPAKVSKFTKERGVNYPVLMGDLKTTRDFGGVYGIPTAFLVNKKGHVVKKYMGFVEHEVLEKDIKSLL